VAFSEALYCLCLQIACIGLATLTVVQLVKSVAGGNCVYF
jgi:hypothetical protein